MALPDADDRRCLVRLTTKLHALVDRRGQLLTLLVTAGHLRRRSHVARGKILQGLVAGINSTSMTLLPGAISTSLTFTTSPSYGP